MTATVRAGATFAPSPRPRVDTEGRPDLRVVADAEPSPAAAQRRARRLAATVVGVAALLLFGVVASHVAITQNQFRLERLERRGDVMQAEYDRLRLQVAELESPARIVGAGQALGLEQPGKVTYLTPSAAPGATTEAADGAAGAARLATGEEARQTTTSWQTVKPHLADH